MRFDDDLDDGPVAAILSHQIDAIGVGTITARQASRR